jgi:hypothetical protein
MSKTVEEIGLIVGGLALAVLSGPIGITLLGSLAITNAMIGIGLTTALAGAGLALRPTVKPVGTANTISFGQGPSPRRVIYGQFQTAGVLTYASFPPSQNLATTGEVLHLVYTLVGHEITSFDAVIINGTAYNFGTDIFYEVGDGLWHVKPYNAGVVNEFYWERIFFEFDVGRAINGAQPFPNLAIADPAWTSACLQKGCAKVHVSLRYDSGNTAVFPGGQLPNIQFLITGKRLADPRITTSQCAWFPSLGYSQYTYVLDNNTLIWVQMNAGTPTTGTVRPNFEAGNIGTVLADNTCSWRCVASWTAVMAGNTAPPQLFNGRLLNDGWIAGFTPGLYYTMEAAPGYLQLCTTNGVSGTTHPSFGKTPQITTTDGAATWTCLGRSPLAINPSNPALVVYDYLLNSDFGMNAPAATIDVPSVIAAATHCEEQVLIIWSADGGLTYENRYACDGMFDHSSVRGNVLTALCGSMAGWVVPPGDQWHVFAGGYVTPTVSLTDNDMRAAIKGDFRLSKRDVANGVKGTFIPGYLPTNPAGALALTQVPPTYQSASFPAYQANGLVGKPNYIAEDGGQIIWQNITLQFTKSIWMAQRLAKITLMRLRFQQTVTLPCKLTALQLEAGDTFFYTHLRWGINGAAFEATQCSIVLDEAGGQVPALGVDIVGRQTDPSVYTFTGPSSPSNYGEYSPFAITGVMTGVE